MNKYIYNKSITIQINDQEQIQHGCISGKGERGMTWEKGHRGI